MKHLPPPLSPLDDEARAQAASVDQLLAPHGAAWVAGYGNYMQNQGDPWSVNAMVLPTKVGDKMYDLYDSQKGSPELCAIRDQTGLGSCPVCGSPTTGHLDHYLPRKPFPEFAIMRANLVPACNHCNVGSKRAKFKGSASPERFIHPYFDSWADNPLWLVTFMPPFAAATFAPVPVAGLTADQMAIVEFHLANVLGKQFHRSMETKFSTMPDVLADRIGGLNVDAATVTAQLKKELSVAVKAQGMNGWDTAFYRGLLLDHTAIAYLANKTLTQLYRLAFAAP